MRKNSKSVVVNYDTSIKKSNELSLSTLNNGLSLNQTQVLAYAIYSTQKNGSTTFIKADFERQFNLNQYRTEHAYDDAKALMDLKISFKDLKKDKFKFSNIFTDMEYDKGKFSFIWNERFLPHILDLKERYIINDLTITAHFKSGYSWVLYEYLKAMYGYWHITLSKEELMKLFNVSEVKSYQANTNLFVRKVLNVAVEEINLHTEINVDNVEPIKKGKAIVGFKLEWSKGEVQSVVSSKLLDEIATMVRVVQDDSSLIMMIDDFEEQQNAVQIFRLIMTKNAELNESTTQSEAQSIFEFIRYRMMELNRLLVDIQKNVGKKSSIYNWLEERE